MNPNYMFIALQKPLRSGIADLFCDSITREISDSSINVRIVYNDYYRKLYMACMSLVIQDLVKKVFKSDIKHRHKVDEALKYCKKLISTFRTEERRRVKLFVSTAEYMHMLLH